MRINFIKKEFDKHKKGWFGSFISFLIVVFLCLSGTRYWMEQALFKIFSYIPIIVSSKTTLFVSIIISIIYMLGMMRIDKWFKIEFKKRCIVCDETFEADDEQITLLNKSTDDYSAIYICKSCRKEQFKKN